MCGNSFALISLPTVIHCKGEAMSEVVRSVYSIREAARYLKKGKPYVRAQIAKGRLHLYRHRDCPDSHPVLKREELDRLLIPKDALRVSKRWVIGSDFTARKIIEH